MEPFFECSQCGQKFDHESFRQIVSTYGLIVLRRARDGVFGGTCPTCKKISVRLGNKEVIESKVLPLIAEDLGFDKPTFLYYDSFPYRLDHSNLKIPAPILYQTKAISDGDRSLTEEELEYPDDQAYCTYAAGDEAMGPAMTVWWFKEDDISELIKFENKSGSRALPRYAPHYDRLCAAMVNYCYEHRLELDLVASDFIENVEPFFVKLKNGVNPWQKSIGENYELLSILSTSHRDPDEEFQAYLDKTSIRIPEGLEEEYFAKIDQSGNFESEKELKEWLEQRGFPVPEVTETARDRIGTSDDERPTGLEGSPSHERMSEIIWSRFNEDNTQDLLSRISTKLINKYMEQSAKIDFTPGLAWKLKDEFLQDVYSAVVSPNATKGFREELDEEQLKQVREAESRFPGVEIISNDYRIRQIKIDISKMARVEKKGISFLLLGESGTGKELFAKAIHEASGREGKFIVADCGVKTESLFESEMFGHVKGAFTGAIKAKKGAFELAHRGTIFLDEIGNLVKDVQPKMLRVLQEQEFQPVGAEFTKKVDVKIILATNQDIAKKVEEGRFMPDLYQRFKRPYFQIPPLRERRGDIPPLVEHFIERNDVERTKKHALPPIRVTEDCMKLLMELEWKEGNARELEKVIEEIMLRRGGGEIRHDITPSDLPIDILQAKGSEVQVNAFRKGKKKRPSDEVLIRLEQEGWGREDVAAKLGVARETVCRWYSALRKSQSKDR